MNPFVENAILEEEQEELARIPKNHIIAQVGNTPLVELKSISQEFSAVRIYAKAEWFNPGGSVKDRAALNMIRDGERSGQLTKDKLILDATSGNTGIAYALIGTTLGYRVKLTIPENCGVLFKQILKAYRAELIFTNPQYGSDGAIEEAIRIYEQAPEKYFYPDQYNNGMNWLAHYEGTGVEIIRQTQGKVLLRKL